MRCLDCNKNLNDFESTAKDLDGKFLDLCGRCKSTAKKDLVPFDEPEEWGDDDDGV